MTQLQRAINEDQLLRARASIALFAGWLAHLLPACKHLPEGEVQPRGDRRYGRPRAGATCGTKDQTRERAFKEIAWRVLPSSAIEQNKLPQ